MPGKQLGHAPYLRRDLKGLDLADLFDEIPDQAFIFRREVQQVVFQPGEIGVKRENLIAMPVMIVQRFYLQPDFRMMETEKLHIDQLRPKLVKFIALVCPHQPVKAPVESEAPLFPACAKPARPGVHLEDLGFETIHPQVTPCRQTGNPRTYDRDFQ